MDQNFAAQSLLPWLDPGFSKVYLKISCQHESSAACGNTSSPFNFLDTSSPLFRLVPALFEIDAHLLLKNVFLVVQKDTYSFSETAVPYNNREIDALWQQAFESGGQGASLPGSENGEDDFPLWRSLFYCKERNSFFHPPCPQCGSLLELCMEDDVLSTANLPPYSSSLERFLFCPSCYASQKSADFFTFSESDALRHGAKDRWALVNGFSLLLNDEVSASGLPCIACPQRTDCYGDEVRATERISFFSFYPFRLLFLEAGQLQGRDFLFLLAGASYDDLKSRVSADGGVGSFAWGENFSNQVAGRMPLFFEGDPRKFLEVLYLKLAFLHQVGSTSFAAIRHLKHPDLRLSLDQFWVNFSEKKGVLPFFWDFTVTALGMGIEHGDKVSRLTVPTALGFYSLAQAWFTSLLENSSQSAGDVNHALALLSEQTGLENDPDFLSHTDPAVSEFFKPENIFWNTDEMVVAQPWLDLWQKALTLGWILLKASYDSDSNFSGDFFLDELESLTAEVKTTLFAVTTEKIEVIHKADPAVTAPASGQEDAEICKLLTNIRNKWQAKTPPAIEEDAVEPPEPVAQEPDEVEEELEKTVILSAEQLASMMEKEPSPAPAAEEMHDSENEAAAVAQHDAGRDLPDEDEELEKTVIMNVKDVSSLLSDEKSSDRGASENTGASSTQKLRQEPVEPEPDVAEDELSETVIINPAELEKLKKMKND